MNEEQLVRPLHLEEICTILHRHKPDVKGIIRRFKSHPHFDPEQAPTQVEYAKHFSEIHLDLCLEQIEKEHPEFNLMAYPLFPKRYTDTHAFSMSNSGRLFIKKWGGIENFGSSRFVLMV
ncbi:MAG: hypothetical protein ABIH34_05760 [Nanoarchaeota archaeon]